MPCACGGFASIRGFRQRRFAALQPLGHAAAEDHALGLRRLHVSPHESRAAAGEFVVEQQFPAVAGG